LPHTIPCPWIRTISQNKHLLKNSSPHLWDGVISNRKQTISL
jgi:hypothetical protein